MKKGILTLLFVSLSCVGNTQILLGGKIGYGYFGILNDNSMGDKAFYSNCLDRIIISIEAKQCSNHLINLGISLDYINQSFDVLAHSGGHVNTYTADANFSIGSLYFEFKPQFTFGKKIRYFFYPGFIFGTLLHSNVKGTLTSNTMDTTLIISEMDRNGSSYFPAFNFGFILGGGLDIKLSSKVILNLENNNNILFGGPSWGSNKSSLYNLTILCGIFYKL
jgi:hypothetical protein